MKKHTLRQSFLAVGVATCLTATYAYGQTQGSGTPYGSPGATDAMTSPGSATGQSGSATRNSTMGTAHNRGVQDQAMTEADRRLNAQIREAFNRDSTLRDASSSVAISSNNGVVTLSGTVATEKEKKDLESELQRVAGVGRVQNELQIAPRPSTSIPNPSTPIR